MRYFNDHDQVFASNVFATSLLLVGIDMLIISKADVVILTYGTFGDFGAILGKDKKEVLYPKGHEAHDESGINWGRLPGFTPLDWKRLQ